MPRASLTSSPTAIPVDQDTVQPIESAAATLSEVGRYCWRGEFDSDTFGLEVDPDASEGECFEIRTPVAWAEDDYRARLADNEP